MLIQSCLPVDVEFIFVALSEEFLRPVLKSPAVPRRIAADN
jgi:hypothetical protein